MSNTFRKKRSSVSQIHIHLVFVTKYRKKILTKNIFTHVCKDFDSQLIEFDGEVDHVHLLIEYPPKVAISRLVNSLKGRSSRLIRKEKLKNVQENLWGNNFWSPSYFSSSCGGGPISIIKQYIENQNSLTS